MCLFSPPSAPVVAQAPLPDPNAGVQEDKRKQAITDANRRKGIGDTDLSSGSLGSNSQATVSRPKLLGQSGAA